MSNGDVIVERMVLLTRNAIQGRFQNSIGARHRNRRKERGKDKRVKGSVKKSSVKGKRKAQTSSSDSEDEDHQPPVPNQLAESSRKHPMTSPDRRSQPPAKRSRVSSDAEALDYGTNDDDAPTPPGLT
ncbi:hypothetical protein BYT27DRAFT_7257933 [Phlegmacium glaucopus]|nr:hypothetical protein BYT27DRAFT_7257933 [Phlegmacium glaucopus]